MTPTLDTALLISSRAGADLGRTLDSSERRKFDADEMVTCCLRTTKVAIFVV